MAAQPDLATFAYACGLYGSASRDGCRNARCAFDLMAAHERWPALTASACAPFTALRGVAPGCACTGAAVGMTLAEASRAWLVKSGGATKSWLRGRGLACGLSVRIFCGDDLVVDEAVACLFGLLAGSGDVAPDASCSR